MINQEAKQEAIKELTFNDVCTSIIDGRMPQVKYKGQLGQVVVIKDNGRYKGIAVDFGKGYDEFFHDEFSEDKRSKYINQLELITNQ